MILPTRQEIEVRAYHLWQQRGSPIGSPEQDWFEAERELSAESSVAVHVAREIGTAIGAVVSFLSELA